MPLEQKCLMTKSDIIRDEYKLTKVVHDLYGKSCHTICSPKACFDTNTGFFQTLVAKYRYIVTHNKSHLQQTCC